MQVFEIFWHALKLLFAGNVRKLKLLFVEKVCKFPYKSLHIFWKKCKRWMQVFEIFWHGSQFLFAVKHCILKCYLQSNTTRYIVICSEHCTLTCYVSSNTTT